MVRVAPAFFTLYKSKLTAKNENENPVSPYEIYIPKMNELSLAYNTQFWNMNEDPTYKCDAFTDASHMATECFPDYTDYLFRNISISLNKK